jgi:hypothetical protein
VSIPLAVKLLFLGYYILGDHLIFASIHWFISHGCLFHEIASTHQSVLSLLFEEGWLPVICFLWVLHVHYRCVVVMVLCRVLLLSSH